MYNTFSSYAAERTLSEHHAYISSHYRSPHLPIKSEYRSYETRYERGGLSPRSDYTLRTMNLGDYGAVR